MLTRIGLVLYSPSKRGRDGDYRKRGAWAIFEYRDAQGHEYRNTVDHSGLIRIPQKRISLA